MTVTSLQELKHVKAQLYKLHSWTAKANLLELTDDIEKWIQAIAKHIEEA